MNKIIFMLALLVSTLSVANNETQLLKYSGSAIEEPYWFKESFLDIADDIEEAKEEGKKLIIYFHQAGCPYCFNLIQQSFLDPQLSPFIQENFDVVALNLWGDREVTLPSGEVISEKALAIRWQIQFTPTLLFYGDKQEPVLRIDGYRNKAILAQILDYVLTGDENTSLAQAVITSDPTQELYPSLAFKVVDSLLNTNSHKPVAVLFEYPGCSDCEQLHKLILSRRDTNELLSAYSAIRVNLSSPSKIEVTPGNELTAREWAEQLGLTYFPSVVLLDAEKHEQFRIDGYVQAFHFQSALEYVSGKVYKRMPEFQRYINERADSLRESGKNVEITH